MNSRITIKDYASQSNELETSSNEKKHCAMNSRITIKDYASQSIELETSSNGLE